MDSININTLHKDVAQLCTGHLDEWVCASVGSVSSTGGAYTYLGCSKPVYGASSSQNWLCRRKVSRYDTFPEECLNHGYKHEGKCCPLEEGIKCYRFSIRLVDQSGELDALIWASAQHLLSAPPDEFDQMSTTQQEDVFQSLQGREWRFKILSVVDELGFRQFKVQFVLPTERSYAPNYPKFRRTFGEVMDLPRLASLTLPTQGRLVPSKASGTLSEQDSAEVESEIALPILKTGVQPRSSEKERSTQDLSNLQACLESLVATSQQNTKAIEQLALAAAQIATNS
jgi:hypothetical protein